MEQEISLREIIEVIWKGKWITLFITLFVIIVTGIYSFFVIEPTYEARVTISANSKNSDEKVSLPLYTEQVKSHAVMSGTIEELQLNTEGVTINSLRNNLRTEIIKDTNLFRIYVKHNNKDQASEIANVITKNFIDYIKNQEFERMIAAINYDLSKLESELSIKNQTLQKIEQELANTPQFIEVNKTLSQNPFLHAVVSDLSSNTSSQTGTIQYTEQVLNPVYLTLQQNATNIQVDIQSIESKIAELQNRVDEQKVYVSEYLLVASPAIPPESPIAPKKTLNVVVAGVLGAMVSVFIVFFMHYWRSTSIDKRVEKLQQQTSV